MSALSKVLETGGNPFEYPFVPTASQRSIPKSTEPQDEEYFPRVYRVSLNAEFEADRPVEVPVTLDLPAGVGLGFRIRFVFPDAQTEVCVFRGIMATISRLVQDFEDQEGIVTFDGTTMMLWNRHLAPENRRSLIDKLIGYDNMKVSECPNGTLGPGLFLTNMNVGPFPKNFTTELPFPTDSGPLFGVDDMGNAMKTVAGQMRHQMTITFNPMSYWLTNDLAAINYANIIQPTVLVEYWYYPKTNAFVRDLITAQKNIGLIGSTWGMQRKYFTVPAGHDGTYRCELTSFSGATAYMILTVHEYDPTEPWDVMPLGRFEEPTAVRLYEGDREVMRFTADPANESDRILTETLFGQPIAASGEEPIIFLSSSLTTDLTNPLGEIRPGLGIRGFSIEVDLELNALSRRILVQAVNHAAIGFETAPTKDGFVGYEM